MDETKLNFFYILHLVVLITWEIKRGKFVVVGFLMLASNIVLCWHFSGLAHNNLENLILYVGERN